MSERKGQWIRTTKRIAIYARDSFKCVYCGEPIVPGCADLHIANCATLDHVLPVQLGGTNEASNLVCCCARCNSRKSDLPLSAFLATLPHPKQVARRVRNATRRSLTGTAVKQGLAEQSARENYESQPVARVFAVRQ